MTLRLLVRATLGQKFCCSLRSKVAKTFGDIRGHFVMFAQELVMK